MLKGYGVMKILRSLVDLNFIYNGFSYKTRIRNETSDKIMRNNKLLHMTRQMVVNIDMS